VAHPVTAHRLWPRLVAANLVNGTPVGLSNWVWVRRVWKEMMEAWHSKLGWGRHRYEADLVALHDDWRKQGNSDGGMLWFLAARAPGTVCPRRRKARQMRWWGWLSTGKIGRAVTRSGRSSAPVMAESRASECEEEAKREGKQGREQ
jgi:hypothetical protein